MRAPGAAREAGRAGHRPGCEGHGARLAPAPASGPGRPAAPGTARLVAWVDFVSLRLASGAVTVDGIESNTCLLPLPLRASPGPAHLVGFDSAPSIYSLLIDSDSPFLVVSLESISF